MQSSIKLKKTGKPKEYEAVRDSQTVGIIYWDRVWDVWQVEKPDGLTQLGKKTTIKAAVRLFQ